MGGTMSDVSTNSPSSSLPEPAASLVSEEQIISLIDKSEELEIHIASLPTLFLSEYSTEPFKDLGRTELLDILLEMTSITIFAGADANDLFVRRAFNEEVESDSLNHMLRVARDMRGGKLHKNVLKVLEQNPNGAKCRDLLEGAKGFVYYLKDCAEEVGVKSISPMAVLRHCEGVKVENIDGKNLVFLDTVCPHDGPSDPTREGMLASNDSEDGIPKPAIGTLLIETEEKSDEGGDIVLIHPECLDEPSERARGEVTSTSNHSEDSVHPPPEPAIRATAIATHTVDGLAAEEFICMLQKEFQGRPWPASRKQLKHFLILEGSNSPKLASWMHRRFSEEVTLGKKRKAAIKCLMDHLKRSKCLKGTNNDLFWNMGAITDILEQNKGTVDRDESNSINIRTVPEHGVDVTGHRGNIPIKVIETEKQLNHVRSLAPFAPREKMRLEHDQVVAIDCEGVPENLYLVQVGTCTATYLFDCVKLGAREVCDALSILLVDAAVTKLFHDLHKDAVALAHIGGVQPICGTLDTQLAVESLTGELHIGFNDMLEQLGRNKHPLKQRFKHKMADIDLFRRRPLSPDVVEYAALDASLLIEAKDSLFAALGTMRDAVQRASDTRAKIAPATGGTRSICFDVANSYSLASLELLKEQRPDDMLLPAPLQVSDDTRVLLEMLPKDLQEALDGRTALLSDIVLDKGRAPLAWVGGRRLFLGEADRMVNVKDISSIVERLGGFGTDNRAGLERQLHRVSAIRNRQSDIIGLTMRIGRHVTGNAAIISDLLYNDCTKSILFLGEPGSGKTTVVREATRLLSERFNVCIVDTSNEIAGDGDVPHPCVGFARRMMVPSLEQQSAVMIECVQNHTPEVMVIDEIGRPTEVEAARTCKQRGVRLMASAHGDLRKLVKNPKLRGLIGGVETVTLGDAQAKVESKKAGKFGIQKLKAQRAGSPVFDVIVELRRGAHHEWRVVLNTASAVDRILEGQNYFVQRRTRDPTNGGLAIELESA